jgi:8-oxo-dGTP pyrophosphatase MutT (NUDIX family)
MAPARPDDREPRALDALWRVAMRLAYRGLLVWWYVRRPRIEGAYVAVWHTGRVLMIRNSYRRRLSLPAGRLERGESPQDAAVRELAEEAGIQVPASRLAYHGEIVNADDYAEDHAHVFELHCEREPAVAVDGREVVWAAFLTPADAIERGVVGVVRRYLESKRP